LTAIPSFTGKDFHAVLNHFPHYYHHHNTIPLPLVSVFISLLEAFDLRAWPVNFPGRVLARVSNPTVPQKPTFVDVYDSKEHAILSHEHDLPMLMSRIQAGEHSHAIHILMPAHTEDMLLRAKHNIFNSFELARPDLRSVSDVELMTSAMYAALCASAICTDDVHSCRQLFAHTRMFPLDARAVLLDGLKPLLGHRAAIVLQSSYEYNGSPDVDVRKSRSDPRVLYKVGTVFRHRIHDYDGCITGWDVSFFFFCLIGFALHLVIAIIFCTDQLSINR
jgi:F-box protein 21